MTPTEFDTFIRTQHGLRPELDPRLSLLTHHSSLKSAAKSSSILSKALRGRLAIPFFPSFASLLDSVFLSASKARSDQAEGRGLGVNAQYIPPLKHADSEQRLVVVCTVDGQFWSRCDNCEEFSKFTVQSISKVVTYAIAVETLGEEKVHGIVGREPSGRSFNELYLNAKGQPHNPFINSGAIRTAALAYGDLPGHAERFQKVCDVWTELCAGRKPSFANETFLAERETADKNFALAYMMRESKSLPADYDVEKLVSLYLSYCSLEVDGIMLSILASTLANGGVNPLTSKRVLSERTVRNCLSLMSSCGMYDGSGSFQARIGLPGKSGVSGCLIVVYPGKFGFCTFSPRLDRQGNSVFGVAFCEQLVKSLAGGPLSDPIFHFRNRSKPLSRRRTTTLLLKACAEGNERRVREIVAMGTIDVKKAKDYDGRNPLHVVYASAKGLIEFLLELGVDANALDRFGRFPSMSSRAVSDETPANFFPNASTSLHCEDDGVSEEDGDGVASFDAGGFPAHTTFDAYSSEEEGVSGFGFPPLKKPVLLKQPSRGEALDELMNPSGSIGITGSGTTPPPSATASTTTTTSFENNFQNAIISIASPSRPIEFNEDFFQRLIRQVKRVGLDINWVLSTKDGKQAHDEFTLRECFHQHSCLFRALQGTTAIPDFERFTRMLFKDCAQSRDDPLPADENPNPRPAQYSTALSSVDVNDFSVSICTVDGQVLEFPARIMKNGEDALDPDAATMLDRQISMQSCFKPFAYGIALESLGMEEVDKRVSCEPSGRSFRDLSVDSKGRPFNPLVNSGGLVTSSLCFPDSESQSARFAAFCDVLRRCSTVHANSVGFSQSVFLGELQGASNRVMANAHVLRASGAISSVDTQHLQRLVEFYFLLCSVTVTVTEASRLAACLANGGTSPYTGEQVFSKDVARRVAIVMHTSGLAEYTGTHQFNCGFPAKSGVSGLSICIVPGLFGCAVYSPGLDEFGNSRRGNLFFENLAKTFQVHLSSFGKFHGDAGLPLDRYEAEDDELALGDLLFACSKGDAWFVRELLAHAGNRKMLVNAADYEGRRAVHMAASEGQIEVLRVLIEFGAKIDNVRDKFGRTPLQDAELFGHVECVKLLSDVNALSSSDKCSPRDRSRVKMV